MGGFPERVVSAQIGGEAPRSAMTVHRLALGNRVVRLVPERKVNPMSR
jgi:hypothetical protein